MDYIDYRKSLGISWQDDKNKTAFYTRVINALKREAEKYNPYCEVLQEEYATFCYNALISYDNYGNSDFFKWIIHAIEDSKNSFEEFLARYVAFMNCLVDSIKREKYKRIVVTALEDSHIPVDIIMDNDGYFIFPKGAKELDDSLVSEILMWLKAFPLTRSKYGEALRRYSEGKDSPSVVADDFRKTLETFFQEFFGLQRNLENMKSEYGGFLRRKGIPTELSNNLETMLQIYTNFNNNHAKHHDNTNAKVLEYIMYQTGSIMRFIISLENSSQNSKEI